MANRATAAFVVSIIGATYQMVSLFVANLVDRNTSLFYYSYGYETLFFTSFLVLWSASHILEEWKGRITWPAIIFAVGISNLSMIIIAYYAQTSTGVGPSSVPSIGSITALIFGPLIITIAGIIGLAAVRQYSQEQGHAVMGQA